jgi:PHD/YefM family antitoxin component YafN of YafNO toxin-antitoxin module
MKSWSVAEARARMSDVFDAALRNGPQKIELRNGESVVMISERDWRRLASEYPTVAELILKCPIDADDLPRRRPARIIEKDLF